MSTSIDYSKINFFIINGFPRSGKDTFCEFVDSNHSKPVFTLSTVDWIKKVAAHCGWNGEKDAKGRKLLSDLKDILTEYDDLPFKKICRDIDVICDEFFNNFHYTEEELTFFIMCREPQEIQKLKDHFDAKTILVTRNTIQAAASNHADSNVMDYQYDIIIENDSDLAALEMSAKTFIEKWII